MYRPLGWPSDPLMRHALCRVLLVEKSRLIEGLYRVSQQRPDSSGLDPSFRCPNAAIVSPAKSSVRDGIGKKRTYRRRTPTSTPRDERQHLPVRYLLSHSCWRFIAYSSEVNQGISNDQRCSRPTAVNAARVLKDAGTLTAMVLTIGFEWGGCGLAAQLRNLAAPPPGALFAPNAFSAYRRR